MTITVEFDRRHYHLQNEMTKWCENHIGKNPQYRNWAFTKPETWEGLGNWCVASMFGYTFFYFKNEKDAIIFTLKWCNNDN